MPTVEHRSLRKLLGDHDLELLLGSADGQKASKSGHPLPGWKVQAKGAEGSLFPGNFRGWNTSHGEYDTTKRGGNGPIP